MGSGRVVLGALRALESSVEGSGGVVLLAPNSRGVVGLNRVQTMARQRELGRGERVLPGLWRLRLPLPWPGIPHCNAWAIASGSGVVLVDTGAHGPGSMADLELALHQVRLRVQDVRLVVCTHAHADHYGQAAPVAELAGCEVWMHPNHEHATRPLVARA